MVLIHTKTLTLQLHSQKKKTLFRPFYYAQASSIHISSSMVRHGLKKIGLLSTSLLLTSDHMHLHLAYVTKAVVCLTFDYALLRQMLSVCAPIDSLCHRSLSNSSTFSVKKMTHKKMARGVRILSNHIPGTISALSLTKHR